MVYQHGGSFGLNWHNRTRKVCDAKVAVFYKKQAQEEGGQFLILSPVSGSAADLSALQLGLRTKHPKPSPYLPKKNINRLPFRTLTAQRYILLSLSENSCKACRDLGEGKRPVTFAFETFIDNKRI